MSARSKARKRALDMLYVAEVRDLPIADVLATETVRHLDQPERASSWDYARQIVTGVDEDRAELDKVIVEHAQGWSIARMPVLDRCILRMGVWELRFNPEVPDAVAIAEAVELAQSLSTEESAGFVNGVLGAVAGGRAPSAKADAQGAAPSTQAAAQDVAPSGRTVAGDQESR
jgi:transcription antitermination protein NusB